MRHPNIVQYMGMSKTDEDVYIITEYLNGGDLYDKLRDETIKIPWKLRVSLAIETCRAVCEPTLKLETNSSDRLHIFTPEA